MAAPTVFKIGNDTFTVLTHEDNYIGHGAYGNVYRGSDDKNRDVAAKRITRVADPRGLTNAVNNLLHLDHNNVANIFGAEIRRNICWVIMDYCPIGNLKKHFRGADLTFNQKLETMIQISLGLEYLHGKNVIHRNINPQNILFSDESHTVKLADFDFNQFLDPDVEKSETTGEALAYKAPEYFTLDEQGQIYYDHNVDIYSSALIFLAMLQFKPGSRELVPDIEAPHVYTSRRIPSIGEVMAERRRTNKPRLNIVHNRHHSSVSASIGAAVVALSGLVAATAHIGSGSNAAFMISAIAGTIVVGTTAVGTAGAYGSKTASKLVGLFVGLYAFAIVVGLRIVVGANSGDDLVRVEPFLYYNAIRCVLSGACSALAIVAASVVGDRAFGLPIQEAIDTYRANAREPYLFLVATAVGSALGSIACVAGVDSKPAFGVGVGALSGCLGAAAVDRNALSSLAGGAAVGAVVGAGHGVRAALLSCAAGALVGGVARLSAKLLTAVLPAPVFQRQNSVSNIARVFCGTAASSVLTGASVAVGVINSSVNALSVSGSLGAIGASAGVTSALSLAVYFVAGRNVGGPFVNTDNDNTLCTRQKRCEMRKLIQKMVCAEPKYRPSASEVVHCLKTIRSLAL